MTEPIISQQSTVLDAVRAIESSNKRICVVLDEARVVVGTLTDGDIRRGLLCGEGLESPVSSVMNSKPILASLSDSKAHISDLMREHWIRAIPICDGNGVFQHILHEWDLDKNVDVVEIHDSFSAAVLMAGGEGRRLRPITDDIPKPMVEINGIPLLHRQIQRLSRVGIKQFYLSVNYLANVIEEYFGDGSKWGISINYLRESKKLGTGGALSLLPELESDEYDILVMNGDVITTTDFFNLYKFHKKHQSQMTVCAIQHTIKVPYGVIDTEQEKIIAIKEKPVQRYLCNAGIYALSKEAIRKIPGDTFYNMTDLVEEYIDQGTGLHAFPVHEYWSDVGTPADLEQARLDFKEN